MYADETTATAVAHHKEVVAGVDSTTETAPVVTARATKAVGAMIADNKKSHSTFHRTSAALLSAGAVK